ncbi:MAG: hypothetical protein AABY00_00800 [Nanoarchaeota archaeon]
MGDAVLCYEIRSQELADLLESRTDQNLRDFRFGRPRQIRLQQFDLDRNEDYGGSLYYADHGFPSIRQETAVKVIEAGRIPNPFGVRVPEISTAKMLLAEPKGEYYSDPIPSKSRTLIQRILSGALRREIRFDGIEEDLVLHGHYLSNGHQYTLAKDLPLEFLKS